MLEPQSKLLTTLCFHFCSFRLPPAFGCGFSQNWEQERVQKWSTTSQDKYEKCFKTHDEERQVYKIKDEMAPRSDEELLQAAREYTSILLVRWSHLLLRAAHTRPQTLISLRDSLRRVPQSCLKEGVGHLIIALC